MKKKKPIETKEKKIIIDKPRKVTYSVKEKTVEFGNKWTKNNK